MKGRLRRRPPLDRHASPRKRGDGKTRRFARRPGRPGAVAVASLIVSPLASSTDVIDKSTNLIGLLTCKHPVAANTGGDRSERDDGDAVQRPCANAISSLRRYQR